jgi:hypothetical protein
MKTVYLLPCACGQKLPVDAGQAGTKVPCTCGKLVTVPTFRGLRDLEIEAPASLPAGAPRPKAWSATRGLLFSAGLLVTVVSMILLAYFGYMYSVVWDGGEAFKLAHIEDFRNGVEVLTPEQAVAEFQQASKEGLHVEGVPPWKTIDNVRDTSIRWLVGSGAALVIGLGCLLGALLVARAAHGAPASPRAAAAPSKAF